MPASNDTSAFVAISEKTPSSSTATEYDYASLHNHSQEKTIMTGFKRFAPSIIFLAPFVLYAFAQSTSITLPTNDDTSGFVVESADGSTVFSAAGDGNVMVSGSVTAATFVGDGSALENVQTVIASVEGNQLHLLSSTYEIIRTVEITVPEDGYIHVTATGYVDWESTGIDILRGAILKTTSNPNTNSSAQTELFRNLCLMTDFACADSSDQYSTFATSRTFSVSSGGTYSYSFWADDASSYYSSSRTVAGDVNMTAMYFPAGSISVQNVGISKAAFGDDFQAIEPSRISIDGN